MLTVAYRFSAFAQAEATLTGSILDRGVDTTGNGLYDYLEIDVQINVIAAGNFQVDVNDLMQSFNGSGISVDNSSQGFLETGIQYLNVSFDGPTIFNSGLNITEVGLITLYDTDDGLMLGSENNIPLSPVYNYTEFDYAFLTGRISDQGVDTEHNGLFDYLEVGIEFNESEAGQYEISVGGLMEQTETYTNYLYDYEYEQAYFAPGVYTAYLNFSGPEIAYNYFNATNVTSIQLSNSAGVQSSFYALPLSRQYDYTLFDAPSENMQVNFKVYPDATVAVDGALNYTHVYPENTGLPQINATIGFSTTGNTTTETSNGTIVFSGSSYSYLNTTEAHMRSVYENGIENDTVNASMILTPDEAGSYPFNTTDGSISAAYSAGLLDLNINGTTVLPSDYSTAFPFNMSDAVVRADFDGTTLDGNITFHAIAGFPLGDVTVYFSGNMSSLQFWGNVNVTYGSFDGLEIDPTSLAQNVTNLNSTFPGEGPSSLYNMTGGYLTCSNLNLTETPWSNALGADVAYNGTVVGNFTGALATLIFPSGSSEEELQQLAYASLQSAASSVRNASLVISYSHLSQTAQVDLHLTCDAQALCENLITSVPPAVPASWSSFLTETQMAALLNIVNATSYAVKDAGLNASYSSAEGKMSMNAWLVSNDSQLKNDVISILPDIAPPSSSYLHDLLESYFNTTYSTVNSSTTTFDLVNGNATFASTVIIQGDFEAELNREKSILIGGLAAITQPTPLPWELRVLNETEINMNNFQAEFSIGQDWEYANFSGLILKLQPDTVDPITFKLRTWLNMTTDVTAPPLAFEKLTITVTGGSTSNQTIVLAAPPDVPVPDQTSADSTTMVWNNASLSSLQDLTFLTAFQQPISYDGGKFNEHILTNSTVTNFAFNATAKQITFDVTGPSGSTGFCNVTIPRDLLNASALSDWTVMLDGKTLTQGEFSITENPEYVFVYLNYTYLEHLITIQGTQVLSEFQPDVLPIVLMILFAFAAVIAVKQRRKLEPARTKFRQTMARLKLSLKPS
jgi:hypothetical protein